MLATAYIFLFEEFRLDRWGDGLSRRDERGVFVPMSIGLRALDVLVVLVERSGNLVTKEEIMAAVWGRTVVENANLTVQISALRRVLDQGRSEEGSCIQTVAGRGYRFSAEVTRVGHISSDGRDYRVAGDDMSALRGRTTIFAADCALPRETVDDLPAPRLLSAAPRHRRNALAAAAATAAAALAIAAIAWWVWLAPTSSPAPRAGVPVAWPTSAPRLSIVVLPFTNLSDDREKQYLGDAIADDVTSHLSRISDLFVVSRNTAFAYGNKPVDTKQIGRELGVRYVLEGSVRSSDTQLRVDTQLINAETEAHLWAERFDGDTGNLFAVRDEITSRIAIALYARLLRVEAAQPTDRPDAMTYLMRGRAAMWKVPTPENWAEAVDFFEKALALEPASVEAQGLLAAMLSARAIYKWTDSAAADVARAEALVGQALAASPLSPFAHYAKGQLLRAQHRCDEAIPEFETVIAINRNWVGAFAQLGWCKFLTGSIEEAIPFLEQSVRLSPRDRQMDYFAARVGLAHLLLSRTDEAITWLKKARSARPASPFVHLFLASAYGLKGEAEPAGAELAEVSSLLGPDHAPSIAGLGTILGDWWSPKVRGLFETTVFAGLRKAGMPEE